MIILFENGKKSDINKISKYVEKHKISQDQTVQVFDKKEIIETNLLSVYCDLYTETENNE